MDLVVFKEWAPDRPALGNTSLTECQNALPLDGVYKSFAPLTGSGSAAPAAPVGSLWSSSPLTGGLYFGSTTNLYRNVAGTTSTLSASTYNTDTDGYWRFVEYDGLMIATNYADRPQAHTVGASTAFTALAASTANGTAPTAQHVGVIGQFVMLGNLKDAGGTARPYTVQWSGIDDPQFWPTPGSATAIAAQSGDQVLIPSRGDVMGIYGNDQFGVVMQEGALTRVTYVGGTTVFQFDEYEVGRGLLFPNSAVQVGDLIYYISPAGFCVTNGTTVRNIGSEKVDNYFRSQVSFLYKREVRAAVDPARELIYWTLCSQTSGSSVPDQIIVYNWNEDRWSRASNTHQCITSPYQNLGVAESPRSIYAWQSSRTLGTFSGTAGTAVFETGEAELSPGTYARVSGLKAIVDASWNANVGYRSDQNGSVTWEATANANSRSNIANFRTEARYHRARVTVTGTFNSAQGVQVDWTPSGAL